MVCCWNSLDVIDMPSSSEYPSPSEFAGRPAAASLSRIAYSWSCGTITVPPPSVSSYDTPSADSWSTTAEASVADSPENSGASVGLLAHEYRANPPSSTAASAMTANVFWGGRENCLTAPAHATEQGLHLGGHQPASS